MVEIARTTLIENSDEHIDLAVYVALMESQSQELQAATVRANPPEWVSIVEASP